jgi:pimeloyl-ACP methyl ester carboxylesterase
LATRIVELGTPAFINEWLAQPMFSHLTDEQSAKVKRYENSAEGMAGSLSNCGTGSQEPLWDRLSTLSMPVLVIAGTQDEKYSSLGQRMVEVIGSNARFVNIEGRHAVHLENPAVTAAVVASWGTQLSG